MNKSESKYFSTAAKMDKALIALLEEKDFEYITVKEICRRAGVNRSTFYLHYENTVDLLEEAIEFITKDFFAAFDQNPLSFVPQIKTLPLDSLKFATPEYLTPYLEYTKQHKTLFRVALRKPEAMRSYDIYSDLFQHVLSPVLERFDVPEDVRDYMIRFYINGITAVVNKWLDGGCEEPVEEIIEIIERCIPR